MISLAWPIDIGDLSAPIPGGPQFTARHSQNFTHTNTHDSRFTIHSRPGFSLSALYRRQADRQTDSEASSHIIQMHITHTFTVSLHLPRSVPP